MHKIYCLVKATSAAIEKKQIQMKYALPSIHFSKVLSLSSIRDFANLRDPDTTEISSFYATILYKKFSFMYLRKNRKLPIVFLAFFGLQQTNCNVQIVNC